MLLLGDILVRQASNDRRANKIAAIFEGRDGFRESITYRELNERVNRIANVLIDSDVARGDRVAVLGRNSIDYVAIYFALAKIGAIMVPINFWFRSSELKYTIDQSSSSFLLVADQFVATYLPVANDLPSIQRVLSYGGGITHDIPRLDDLCAGASDAEPELLFDLRESDPHIILYTSGTTGFPKGATISHRAHYLHALAWALQTRQVDDDVGIVVYPLFHTGGPDCVVLPHFIVGGTVVIHDGADPEMILDSVERNRLTNVFCVPIVWRRLLASASIASRDLQSVRRCLGSSDTLPPDLLDDILIRFTADVYVTYGLTEAGCILTFSRLIATDKTAIATVGRPHPLVDVRVVGPEGTSLPTGQVGEVIARGPTLMDKYWGMPERTAETLIDGWLHTGDLGRFDQQGNLAIVGRLKDMIVSGGEKIYPVEVEKLIRAYPAVQDCALIGVPDLEWGESVLAVIVPYAGATLDASDIQRYVRSNLAGFKTPKFVEFVDSLPSTTATGKVQKAVLRERYRSIAMGNRSE